MAGFVQIIEYRTSKPDEIAELSDEFRKSREASQDGPAPGRVIVCADRDDPGRYFIVVEFESFEAAMENNDRPETNEFAEKMAAMCDGPVKFYNLDLMQVQEYKS
ncbi:quinol monooxygenase YgiN [Kribbella sp. VKM Ac-2527]|uniref:Quinol monooxygenase YgiN n=1 Tax=Kribbella caucasensis TaxID=2512215 RepID=A0A4R6JL36_9ACTN|nr:hypothetical protein [Kribbella sp. VKM Ac-2527]TDO35265.1 quinol monooxygenase YgiN [Kribbella sp. VKM Ac-2527]